jgi:hypothetical protein
MSRASVTITTDTEILEIAHSLTIEPLETSDIFFKGKPLEPFVLRKIQFEISSHGGKKRTFDLRIRKSINPKSLTS